MPSISIPLKGPAYTALIVASNATSKDQKKNWVTVRTYARDILVAYLENLGYLESATTKKKEVRG